VAVLKVQPIAVDGPWLEGFVLERHTVKSVYFGDDQAGNPRFETTRTELGECVYQFKNRRGSAEEIVETAVAFIRRQWPDAVDCVVYPPPSLSRAHQPAEILAARIARVLGAAAPRAVVIKRVTTPQMKNVPAGDRQAILASAMQPRYFSAVQDKRVLLVDDLWETGATLRVVGEVLSSMGVAELRALAMTYTKQLP
jgi:competence protein ComFC